MHPYPIVAISSGEPSGIGPDILIQLAQTKHKHSLLVFGDPDIFQQRAKLIGLPLKIDIPTSENEVSRAISTLSFSPVTCPVTITPGKITPESAPYVLQCIQRAVDHCSAGKSCAVVTAPVHKGVINEAGIPFSGHTEYIADLTHTEHVVMMLATEGLRVALATTHLPLSKVASSLTQENLFKTILILNNALKDYFCRGKPYISISGLNPHAGEGGHLGTEELNIIQPAIDQARDLGINISNPLPADTMFAPAILSKTDAVLSMYHDQGLPVLKYIGFGKAINITLGLPIIRTSVDHGTALDLAGKGTANEASLAYAITMALQMHQKTSGF